MTTAVMIEMTEERKKRWNEALHEILFDICRDKYRFSPFEAHGLLKLALQSLGETYDIEDSRMLMQPTDKTQ